MSKFEFRPGDFWGIREHLSEVTIEYEAARFANRIFDEWLGKQPKVYGQWSGVFRRFGESAADKVHVLNTHQARLVCIEPIEKKPIPADPEQINILNLNVNQIEKLIAYYEANTGNKAEAIGMPCDHEPRGIAKDFTMPMPSSICKKCNKQIIAKWETAE